MYFTSFCSGWNCGQIFDNFSRFYKALLVFSRILEKAQNLMECCKQILFQILRYLTDFLQICTSFCSWWTFRQTDFGDFFQILLMLVCSRILAKTLNLMECCKQILSNRYLTNFYSGWNCAQIFVDFSDVIKYYIFHQSNK